MGITASTWDTVNKGSSVTLSGGNLTATVSSGTGSVRGTNRLSGLTYGETTIGATLTGSARVGCCNQAFSFSSLLGVDNNGCGYDSGGTVKINNTTVATLATFAAGNRIGWAIDPLRMLIWFRVNGGNWNNDVIANQNPVGAVGGISLSALGGTLSPAWGGSATSSATAAFASGSLVDAAPTGYLSVDTLQSSAFNGGVASRSASFSQYGRANGSGAPASPSIVLTSRALPLNLGSTSTTVSGQIQENGVPVSGKKVWLFDRRTGCDGELIGTATSDGSGNWSIPALGRASTMVVAVDPPYDAIVYDAVVPV